MAAPAHNKYVLKSLHEEIDLFDRKLAHMLKYEAFATDAARKSSTGKLQAKRDLLARTARQLASEGIEFQESDLPRSFREASAEPTDTAAVQAPELSAAAAPVNVPAPHALRSFPSPFAGTVLDGQANVEEYKRSRGKAAASQA